MLKIYLVQNFEHTHERDMFDTLCTELKKEWDKKDEAAVLIGNVIFNNREIDAVFIKEDAVTVIEMKNYGGKIHFSQNGDWTANDRKIGGGANGKNPFIQVRNNRSALLRDMEKLQSYFVNTGRNIVWNHISGMVLFGKSIEFAKEDLPGNVSIWFAITDMSTVAKRLSFQTSQALTLSESEMDALIKLLNIETRLQYQTPVEIVETILSTDEPQKNEFEKISNVAETVEMLVHLQNHDWKVAKTFPIAATEPVYGNIDDIKMGNTVKKYWNNKHGGKIYTHQLEAINKIAAGENLCLATSTGSGKSAVFYSAAIEILSKDPNSKIIALYPQKALGCDQEIRWKECIQAAGLSATVARVDGDISKDQRVKLLDNNVIIMTPDIIHAWAIKNIGDTPLTNRIIGFLSGVKLVVVDEVHNYAGVFGTNAAYLLRRLNHCILALSGSLPQYITASATINNPILHLTNLIGMPTQVISSDQDRSKKFALDIHLVEMPDANSRKNVIQLVKFLACCTDKKVLMFMDNRQDVEKVVVQANKGKYSCSEVFQTVPEAEELETTDSFSVKKDTEFPNGIYPYRAGIPGEERLDIQNKLNNGEARVVVSTSALELGLDISGLDIVILYGVPDSSTVFNQRIGRVARNKPGTVLVINNLTSQSQRIFLNPGEILNLPAKESTLYLENKQIQFIHALCFAKQGMEYDSVTTNKDTFETRINFPSSFIQLCKDERNGQYTREYEAFRNDIERPHTDFPLRDLQKQYKIVLSSKRGTQWYEDKEAMGYLSEGQVFREAYPGAIYFQKGARYRVRSISRKARKVVVSAIYSKNIYMETKPSFVFTRVVPNFKGDNIFSATKIGNLRVIETQLNIQQSISSIVETTGANKETHNYPLSNPKIGNYNKPYYNYNLPTTGVIIFHPSVKSLDNGEREKLSKLLYNSLLMHVAFDRNDIGFGTDNLKVEDENEHLKNSEAFLAIYDQTYQGLRLSQKMCEANVLQLVIEKAIELTGPYYKHENDIETVIIEALKAMLQEFDNEPQDILGELKNNSNEDLTKAIVPGSVGLLEGTKRVKIMKLIFNQNGLKYKAIDESDNSEYSVSTHKIEPINGVSIVDFYNIEEGEWLEQRTVFCA